MLDHTKTCLCFWVGRFVTAVYPSAEDDVITSPYNSVLAMHQLTDCADCVLPVENQVSRARNFQLFQLIYVRF